MGGGLVRGRGMGFELGCPIVLVVLCCELMKRRYNAHLFCCLKLSTLILPLVMVYGRIERPQSS